MTGSSSLCIRTGITATRPFDLLRIVLTAIGISTAITSATAETRPGLGSPQREISTELIVGEVSDGDDPYAGWIGVRVRLGPSWKIYWKVPGDAGLPPEFDWSASSNLATAEIQWPAPHRTSILGVESIGYTGEIVFPVKIQVLDPDLNSKVELKLTLYACSTICIREERVLNADLSHPSDPDSQTLIDEWRAKVPPERSASLSIESIKLVRSHPPHLRLKVLSALPLEHPDLFVASTPPAIFAGRPKIESVGDRTILTSVFEGSLGDITRASNIEVTLVDGSRAVTSALSPNEPRKPDPPANKMAGGAPDGTKPWWTILFTALLGGVVLNLMPCVFPVLSLKLLTFVRDDVAERGGLRPAFVATAFGVIASFVSLAVALIGLKAAGVTVGWGIQFQQPIFLAVMAAVVSLFAANLLGFFDVSLPTAFMNTLARRGMGSSLPSHIASGFVATLLATPCSAPFVGTAVAFALSSGTPEVLAVFGALGVGMASPYLLVACVPSSALILPRPGRWMIWLKRAMAVPMLATSAWLITLVDATAGLLSALMLTAALVAGFVVLWWRATKPSTTAAMTVSLLAAGIAIVAVAYPTEDADTQPQAIQWRPFSELDRLVRSGHTVFLDITADWCVTCKVNKALVINDQIVSRRLMRDVIPVRADWTRPDPRIAEYLKSFGRYGIPFNVVFGPNAPEGVVLPELLTTEAVLAAFVNSSGSAHPSIEQK